MSNKVILKKQISQMEIARNNALDIHIVSGLILKMASRTPAVSNKNEEVRFNVIDMLWAHFVEALAEDFNKKVDEWNKRNSQRRNV